MTGPRHDAASGRFELDLDAGIAFVEYELDGDVLDLVSTWVPPEHRSRGIGERLVLHVLGYARAEGLAVIPTCPFVPGVIDQHPEFRSLVPRTD